MSRESGLYLVSCGASIFVAILIGWLWSWQKCESQTISFTLSSWGPIQGCMVLHKDRWLPLENIRGFDDKG